MDIPIFQLFQRNEMRMRPMKYAKTQTQPRNLRNMQSVPYLTLLGVDNLQNCGIRKVICGTEIAEWFRVSVEQGSGQGYLLTWPINIRLALTLHGATTYAAMMTSHDLMNEHLLRHVIHLLTQLNSTGHMILTANVTKNGRKARAYKYPLSVIQ